MTSFSKEFLKTSNFSRNIINFSFSIYTLQSLNVDQCRVPDCVSEQSPSNPHLCCLGFSCEAWQWSTFCPNVLAAPLQHMVYSFFPSCYSDREIMLSSSCRPLFRKGESIFSLLKGHEGQKGSEQVLASTLHI